MPKGFLRWVGLLQLDAVLAPGCRSHEGQIRIFFPCSVAAVLKYGPAKVKP